MISSVGDAMTCAHMKSLKQATPNLTDEILYSTHSSTASLYVIKNELSHKNVQK